MTLSISPDDIRQQAVITESKPLVSEAEMQQADLDHASRLTGLLESQPSLGTISVGIAIAFGVVLYAKQWLDQFAAMLFRTIDAMPMRQQEMRSRQ